VSLPLAILLGLAPSAAWLVWVWRRDDHEREPIGLLLWAFALGALSAGVVWWAAPVWGGWIGAEGSWAEAFAVTAPVEELTKLLFLLPLLLHREVDEPLDGVVYGAAVALGFSAVENAYYGHWTGSAVVVGQRTFSATLVHLCCTAGAGFACVMARFAVRSRAGAARGRAALWVGAGVVFAWGIHGIYDALLGHRNWGTLPALLGVLPIALLALTVKMRWARAQSPIYHAER